MERELEVVGEDEEWEDIDDKKDGDKDGDGDDEWVDEVDDLCDGASDSGSGSDEGDPNRVNLNINLGDKKDEGVFGDNYKRYLEAVNGVDKNKNKNNDLLDKNKEKKKLKSYGF